MGIQHRRDSSGYLQSLLDRLSLTIQHQRQLFDQQLYVAVRLAYRTFQLACRIKNRVDSDISRRSLEGVRKTLCQAVVSALKGRRNSFPRRTLPGRKPT